MAYKQDDFDLRFIKSNIFFHSWACVFHNLFEFKKINRFQLPRIVYSPFLIQTCTGVCKSNRKNKPTQCPCANAIGKTSLLSIRVQMQSEKQAHLVSMCKCNRKTNLVHMQSEHRVRCTRFLISEFQKEIDRKKERQARRSWTLRLFTRIMPGIGTRTRGTFRQCFIPVRIEVTSNDRSVVGNYRLSSFFLRYRSALKKLSRD